MGPNDQTDGCFKFDLTRRCVLQEFQYNQTKMIFTKQYAKDKKSNSTKKVHRRVITEIEEQPVVRFPKPELKKSDKMNSKPKFLDVYSKYVPKEPISQRRNFKLYQNKPLNMNEKHLKTQPDEIAKNINLSGTVNSKVRMPLNRYEIEGVAGKGTFGVVYFGVNKMNGEKIAIKKVFQDKKYKNREHQILKVLKHPSILYMKDSFTTNEGEEEYLNIVMDYFEENLYQAVKKKEMTSSLIKLYAYQIFRGLNYLNILAIAHRDIKPQNILVNKSKHHVIISDFGSAKQLVKSEPNLAYICSRCYRAPQLIFGATDYTPQIDMWSTGCVLVEMINGSPPFMGDSQVDQLIEIIKILGTPSKVEVEEMNKLYDMREYTKFPKIKTTPWKNLLQTKDPQLIDLVTKVLQYSPKKRITPAQALMHQYFDQIRDQVKYHELLLRVKNIPELFDFSEEEIHAIRESNGNKVEIIPGWALKNAISLQNNKITNSSTNTKRSLISFKQM